MINHRRGVIKQNYHQKNRMDSFICASILLGLLNPIPPLIHRDVAFNLLSPHTGLQQSSSISTNLGLDGGIDESLNYFLINATDPFNSILAVCDSIYEPDKRKLQQSNGHTPFKYIGDTPPPRPCHTIMNLTFHAPCPLNIFAETNCQYNYPSCSIVPGFSWDSHCLCYKDYPTTRTDHGARGHPWWCPICVGAPNEIECREHYTVNYDTSTSWNQVNGNNAGGYYRNETLCRPSILFGECRDTTDCESSLVCTNRFCKKPLDSSCVPEEDQCDDGLSCIGGMCLKIGTCNSASDCNTNICVDKVCETGQELSPCANSTGNCQAPLICAQSIFHGWHCSSGNVGSSCTSSSDCTVPFCVEDECSAGSLGSSCATASDCLPHLLCQQHDDDIDDFHCMAPTFPPTEAPTSSQRDVLTDPPASSSTPASGNTSTPTEAPTAPTQTTESPTTPSQSTPTPTSSPTTASNQVPPPTNALNNPLPALFPNFTLPFTFDVILDAPPSPMEFDVLRNIIMRYSSVALTVPPTRRSLRGGDLERRLAATLNGTPIFTINDSSNPGVVNITASFLGEIG